MAENILRFTVVFFQPACRGPKTPSIIEPRKKPAYFAMNVRHRTDSLLDRQISTLQAYTTNRCCETETKTSPPTYFRLSV